MRKITNTIFLLILSAVLFSCSSVENYNTAIRIKPGKEGKYSINPNTLRPRNGSTLRGQVVRVDYITEPDTCPAFTKFVTNRYVVFIDSANKDDLYQERIPVEDIVPISRLLNIEPEKADTLFFETYNDPLFPKDVKAFPVNIVKRDCSDPCPCEGFSLQTSSPFSAPVVERTEKSPLSFACKQRDLKWYFISAQYTQNFYEETDDKGKKQYYSQFGLDGTIGVRLGESYRWNIGMMYSLLPKTFDILDSNYHRPYVANLYFKYDLVRKKRNRSAKSSDLSSLEKIVTYDTIKTMSNDGFRDSVVIVQNVKTKEILNMSAGKQYNDFAEVRACPNPYIFGSFGLAIDAVSRDLIKLNIENMDCEPSRLEAIKKSGLDISMPYNFQFGCGLEIPLTNDLDLTLDASYRAMAFGERRYYRNLITPTRKSLNALVFRIGLNF